MYLASQSKIYFGIYQRLQILLDLVNQVKKILKNNMKLNIQVNSNILCKDLIKVSINEFNSIFQKEESQYYLEDSNDAIDKCYEL